VPEEIGLVRRERNNSRVTAVNDITVKAANVTIDAAKNSLSIDQQGVSGSGYERAASSDETLTGGVFAAGNNLSITATKGDVTATGAQLTATTGATTITAEKGDVNLLDATTEHSSTYELYKSSHSGFGSGILGGDGMTGAQSQSSLSTNSTQSTIAEGSTVSGATISISAGHDINVTGSNVVSDTQTTLKAGGNVTITAATDTTTSTSFADEKKSGFGALGGGGPSYGTREQSTANTTTSTSAAASSVGSLYGNVTITSGGTYTQSGSNVVAPEGDVTITAKKVDITDATETSTSDTEQKFKQAGVSASVSNPIINAIESVGEISRASSRTDDPRAQALAAATVGLTAYNTYNAISGAKDPVSAATSFGINISLGSTKSQSDTHEETSTSAGSKVLAGGNISITATGGGSDSTITVQGSDITAGNNAALKADGKVNLLAGENIDTQDSTNSSNSASVGMGINFGSQSGLSFNASASHGSGSSDSTSTTWTNTHVTAGNTVDIQSGGDTTLNGAVVSANTVTGKIDGDLNLGSLQDTSTYTSKQSSSGGGVSVCIPPLCYGSSSVSVNVANANVTGNYASVTEQTGIKAGDGGFQLDVHGVTNLNGAVITSTEAAIQAGKNSLSTLDVRPTDIQNGDSYNATGYSVGASLTGMVGDQSSATTDAQKAAVKAGTEAKPVGGSAGYSSESGSQSSVTQSGISAGAVAITSGDTGSLTTLNRTVTTGTDTTHAITQAWDGGQLLGSVQAGAQITAAFLQSATSAWGTYANQKLADATTDDEKACWAANGPCRVAGHTIIGALGGGAEGALGMASSTTITPIVGRALADAGITGPGAEALITAVATGIGAAAGGAAGATAASTEVVNNYLTTWQQDAKNSELTNCKSLACKGSVQLKYALIDAKQDTGLITGVFGGIGYQSVAQGTAVVSLVANLPETLTALKAIVTDPTFRAQVGDQIANEYADRISLQTQAYNDGGWDGSVTAGVEAGRLAVDIVSAAGAAVGTARLLAIAATAGASLTTTAFATLGSAVASDARTVSTVTSTVGTVAVDTSHLTTTAGDAALTFGDNGRKLDFLFNSNIDPSNAYNLARAAGNATRIGIADTTANRAEVVQLFNQAYNDPASIVGAGTVPGSVVREFFLPGVTGTGSTIQFVELNGKVLTIIAR
jgi:filamentous hemagglutinin